MIDKSKLTKRQAIVFDQVRNLYETSQRKTAKWLWNHHVQIVGENCLRLAHKYNGDADLSFAGALLHDLGDVWLERKDPQFTSRSKKKAKEILKNADFSTEEINDVLENIIGPHSCRDGNLPTLLEGKILATADAIAHLQTNFYYDFKKMGLPDHIQPEEFSTWVSEKLERDFNTKIFFDEIREEVKHNYEKLKGDLR
ncbi:MAG: HD domain-containing protein [Candidatus Curtissbacteria bacterium]|nr:HD domain-containing protein [Candidatus Curtissbacteria bacterium]